MRICVHEIENEVHIALYGVTGRQQHVLQVIRRLSRTDSVHTELPDRRFVCLRADSKDMHIKLRNHNGQRYDANAIYRELRHVLLQRHSPNGCIQKNIRTTI